MRLLRPIGALFSPDALGYWRALYVSLLVVWSVSTIWRVVSGFLLETPDNSPTLIKIGLLEAVAFLAAWSLLLITLTTKVVSKGKDLEFAAEKTNMAFRQHLEGHPDVQDVQGMVSDIDEVVTQVKREADQVAEENKQLRKQLAPRATDD